MIRCLLECATELLVSRGGFNCRTRVTCVVLFARQALSLSPTCCWKAFMLPKQPEDERVLRWICFGSFRSLWAVVSSNLLQDPERYGIHADAGHVPPKPPQGEGIKVERQEVYIAYRHNEPSNEDMPHTNRILIVITVAVAMTALLLQWRILR